MVDDVAEEVDRDLGDADLRRLHDHDVLHQRRGRQRVHDLAQEGRAGCAPPPALAGLLAGKLPMLVRPRRHRKGAPRRGGLPEGGEAVGG